MPTGTGKTITVLSLCVSYQMAHPEVGKLIYCSGRCGDGKSVGGGRAASDYIGSRVGKETAQMLALGLSSRKNMCVNPAVAEEGSRENVDGRCRRLTASWTESIWSVSAGRWGRGDGGRG